MGDSSKRVHQAPDRVHGADLAIVQIGEITETYLEIHSQTVPKTVVVALEIDDVVYRELAYCHAGGQRIAMSDQMQERMMAALREHKSIRISLPGYSTVIETRVPL